MDAEHLIEGKREKKTKGERGKTSVLLPIKLKVPLKDGKRE